MFFYRFGPHTSNNIYQSPEHKTKAGDLIFDGERYYLNLGDEISRPEQGYTNHTITLSQKIPSLCHHKTIEQIHRMVNERFSSYNKVIPLFLGSEIEILLKHKKPVKANNTPQQLLIFPSILSIQQYLDQKYPPFQKGDGEAKRILTLTGSSTLVQKSKAYRSISSGQDNTILTTHSQIFQNRNHLTEIHVMDPHSPYYRTFQDPRYNIHMTIEYMRKLYNI